MKHFHAVCVSEPRALLRRLLFTAIILALRVPAQAASMNLDLDGLRIGASEQELRRIFPSISCQSYKRRFEADVICTGDAQRSLVTVPAITFSLELIGDRLTRATARIQYEHFTRMFDALESRLGSPIRRFKSATSSGSTQEHITWRAGTERLSMQAFHGCPTPGGCDVTVDLSDEATESLLKKRRALLARPPPRPGNTSPSSEQREAGVTLSTFLKRVLSMKDLSPDDVRQELGFDLEPTRRFSAQEERYSTGTAVPHLPGTIYSAYPLTKKYDLPLSIDDHGACITEALLEKEWGEPFERWSGTPHNYGRRTPLPEGLRNPPDVYTYKTRSGIIIHFNFSYVCASSVVITTAYELKPRPSSAAALADEALKPLIVLTSQVPPATLPPSVEQTYVIKVSAQINGSCVAINSSLATITIDRGLLERLSAQRPARWRTENERMAIVHGDRATRLLAALGPAPTSGCSSIDTTALRDSRYLVGALLEAGMAAVFHKPTKSALTQITVKYPASSSVVVYLAEGSPLLGYARWVH